MIEHPNSLLVHHCLQAANEGDRQTLSALWAPDIVWHLKGNGPLQGDIKGAENVFEFLAQIGNVGRLGVQADVEDVLVSNRRAAVICHAYAELGDRVLDADFLVIAEITSRRARNKGSSPASTMRIA